MRSKKRGGIEAPSTHHHVSISIPPTATLIPPYGGSVLKVVSLTPPEPGLHLAALQQASTNPESHQVLRTTKSQEPPSPQSAAASLGSAEPRSPGCLTACKTSWQHLTVTSDGHVPIEMSVFFRIF